MHTSLAGILSTRQYLKDTFYQVIYEWEDDLARQLAVPLKSALPKWRKTFLNNLTRPVLARLGALDQVNNWVEAWHPTRPRRGTYLVFELGANTTANFSTSAYAIPAFIDLWQNTDWQALARQYRYCPLVLVSSLETVQYMQVLGSPLPVAHFPLSLSDRYRTTPDQVFAKQYDLVLAGRTNPVLASFVRTFSERNPTVEVVSQQEVDGQFQYVSNHRGALGPLADRSEYLDLLRKARISVYSTPGIDGGEARTGGFNPVTPRYLELLHARCRLIGRYPDNAETRFYELAQVCPHVDTYAEFEALMHQYLAQESGPLPAYEAILSKHYTSCRATLLQRLLSGEMVSPDPATHIF